MLTDKIETEYYDKESDIIYIGFKGKPYSYSVEYGDSVLIDYDREDKLIGVELLGVSRIGDVPTP